MPPLLPGPLSGWPFKQAPLYCRPSPGPQWRLCAAAGQRASAGRGAAGPRVVLADAPMLSPSWGRTSCCLGDLKGQFLTFSFPRDLLSPLPALAWSQCRVTSRHGLLRRPGHAATVIPDNGAPRARFSQHPASLSAAFQACRRLRPIVGEQVRLQRAMREHGWQGAAVRRRNAGRAGGWAPGLLTLQSHAWLRHADASRGLGDVGSGFPLAGNARG